MMFEAEIGEPGMLCASASTLRSSLALMTTSKVKNTTGTSNSRRGTKTRRECKRFCCGYDGDEDTMVNVLCKAAAGAVDVDVDADVDVDVVENEDGISQLVSRWRERRHKSHSIQQCCKVSRSDLEPI